MPAVNAEDVNEEARDCQAFNMRLKENLVRGEDDDPVKGRAEKSLHMPFSLIDKILTTQGSKFICLLSCN